MSERKSNGMLLIMAEGYVVGLACALAGRYPPSTMPPTDDRDLLIIPTPKRVEFLGGEVAMPADGQVSVRDVRLPGRPDERSIAGQAYSLRVVDPASDGNGRLFEIATASPAGRRNAVATMQQLMRRFPKRMPRLAIHDEPAFAVRGVMMDISRDRVPTMSEFARWAELFAVLKINHLQLYTEHTFAYSGHEEVWRGWGAVTPDEAREMSRICAEHGIELAANQNCFGHLAHWLRMPRYAGLAETHGDWMFDVWPRSGPFSLCPIDPASDALVGDLLGQLLPCFDSPLVNIGADETYDIGWGRSKDEVARRGKGAVYADFVARVCAMVRARGKRPQFWADIALSHPEALSRLPSDLIALAWGYEPDSKFDAWCRAIAGAPAIDGGRMETWVCPGTSAWRSITGRTSERRGNLHAAAVAGVQHSAPGFLICNWGDIGHTQQWPIEAHAIAHGAHAAWTGEATAFDHRACSLHVFDDGSLSVGEYLETLGDIDEPLRRISGRLSKPAEQGEFRLLNATALFADMHNPETLHDRAEVGSVAAWEEISSRLAAHKPPTDSRIPSQIMLELIHSFTEARLAAARGLTRRRALRDGRWPGERERSALSEELADHMEHHRVLWLGRSRDGLGLDDSLARFERVRRITSSPEPESTTKEVGRS